MDASRLTVKITSHNKTNPRLFGGTVQGISDFVVHGGVTLIKESNGKFSIISSPYDFEQHNTGRYANRARGIARNVETAIGECAATSCGLFSGKPFMIDYSGYPNVTH